MPEYILAYHRGEMPDSPDEGAKLREKWNSWLAELGETLVNPGTPLGESKTVSATGVADHGGPNPLMGYSIVKADSLDAAVEIAKGCPFVEVGTIEVAQMLEMS